MADIQTALVIGSLGVCFFYLLAAAMLKDDWKTLKIFLFCMGLLQIPLVASLNYQLAYTTTATNSTTIIALTERQATTVTLLNYPLMFLLIGLIVVVPVVKELLKLARS